MAHNKAKTFDTCHVLSSPSVLFTAATGGITCLDPALHSEVELLLENYHRQLVVIDAQINILRQRVRVSTHHARWSKVVGVSCVGGDVPQHARLFSSKTLLSLVLSINTHTHTITQVQSAQEVFAINVDLHRNRVLRTTLLLTMLSTSFASAATVASFLGS